MSDSARKVESEWKAPMRARWIAMVSFRAAIASGLLNGSLCACSAAAAGGSVGGGCRRRRRSVSSSDVAVGVAVDGGGGGGNKGAGGAPYFCQGVRVSAKGSPPRVARRTLSTDFASLLTAFPQSLCFCADSALLVFK